MFILLQYKGKCSIQYAIKWRINGKRLNSIANVQDEVDIHLQSLADKLTSKEDLWSKIESFWSEVKIGVVKKLIKTMC